MSNPLIDKYEEIYGEKKEEEVVEEKKEEYTTGRRYTSSIGLPGGMGNDHLIFGSGGSDTISFNPAHAMSPSALISNTTINTTPTKNTFTIPNKCVKDEMFCKVLKDVESGKATIYNISSQVDKSYTGFGGQICYTIEIVSTYP